MRFHLLARYTPVSKEVQRHQQAGDPVAAPSRGLCHDHNAIFLVPGKGNGRWVKNSARHEGS
jgi:hypothetical protein